MGEFSIEQKAKLYDEALKYAMIYYKEGNENMKMMIKTCFPALVEESSDERIRKALIKYFTLSDDNADYQCCGVHCKDIVAWLEKQGRQDNLMKALQFANKTIGELTDENYYLREKLNEQEPADKVEPKFKNGQWIVWQNKYYKVNDNGCGYELVDQDGLSTSLKYGTIDENAHFWDITKDAKDSDVLASYYEGGICIALLKNVLSISEIEMYCHLINDDLFIPKSGYSNAIWHPATKEQRDLLFQKMKEAGYEWDAEKKELKEIIDEKQIKKNLQDNSFRKMFEQKPTKLSEEDIKVLNRISTILVNASEVKNWWKEYRLIERDEMIRLTDWLKSLKDRVQPQQKLE